MAFKVIYDRENKKFERLEESQAISALASSPDVYETLDDEVYTFRNPETGHFIEDIGRNALQLLGDGYEYTTQEQKNKELARRTLKEAENPVMRFLRRFSSGTISGATLGAVDPIDIQTKGDKSVLAKAEREMYKESKAKAVGEVAGVVGGAFSRATPAGLAASGSVALAKKAGALGVKHLPKGLKTIGGGLAKAGGFATPWAVGSGVGKGISTAVTSEEKKVSSVMKKAIGEGLKEGSETFLQASIFSAGLGAVGLGLKGVGLTGKKSFQWLTGTKGDKVATGLREKFFGVSGKTEKLNDLKKAFNLNPEAKSETLFTKIQSFITSQPRKAGTKNIPITTKEGFGVRLLEIKEDLIKKLTKVRAVFQPLSVDIKPLNNLFSKTLKGIGRVEAQGNKKELVSLINNFKKIKNPTLGDLRQMLEQVSEKAKFGTGVKNTPLIRAYKKLYKDLSRFEDVSVGSRISTVAKDINRAKRAFKDVKANYNRVREMEDLLVESMNQADRANFFLIKDAIQFGGGLTGLGALGVNPFGPVPLLLAGGVTFGRGQLTRTGYRYLQTAKVIDRMNNFTKSVTNPKGLKNFIKSKKPEDTFGLDSEITMKQLFFMMTGRPMSVDDNNLTDFAEDNYYLEDGDMSSLIEDYGGMKNANEYYKKNMEAKRIVAGLAPQSFTDQYGVEHKPSKLETDQFLKKVNEGLSFPQFMKGFRDKTLTRDGYEIAMLLYPQHLQKVNIAVTQGLQTGELEYKDLHWYLNFVSGFNNIRTNLLYASLDYDIQARVTQQSNRGKLKRKDLHDTFSNSNV